jgi:probable O-glycosylation ligase (exosortase A-associated)
LFGGGFNIYSPEVFVAYSPEPDRIHAAHSVYFQMLGEHGFVVLGLFLLLGIVAWRTAGWIRRVAKKDEANRWAFHVASMCQVSLIGYAVGGAFLSLAYFDLPYFIVVILLATKWILQTQPVPLVDPSDPAKSESAGPAPREGASPA